MGLFFPPLFVFLYYFWFIFKRYRVKRKLKEASKKPLYGKSKEWLVNDFPYYKRLKADNKIKFIQKLQWYKNYADFISKKVEPISDLDKTQICACAAQITFGFPDEYLTYFTRVFFFDDVFKSASLFKEQKVVGEVTEKGTIAISQKMFLEGYRDPSDGVNLGLHEMAHAVYIQNNKRSLSRKFIKVRDLNKLHKIALELESLIKSGEVTFISKYAVTNFDEFFSVLTELFFEKPRELRGFHKSLYTTMSKIYRQELC
ncbi:MAG: zinc-dependent peptidase [Cyclobacteriaceae bacterium]